MYAIIQRGSKQHKIEVGDTIRTEKIDSKAGEKIELNDVLLIKDEDRVLIGKPYLSGAKVIAEIKAQERGKKIVIGKFKRRKGYRRKAGHRQDYTKLFIKEIKLPKPAAKKIQVNKKISK
ncbi:50S ribosomal protein L21 [bacterium]|nr:50S ribosomal protein L21 [bacterium]